jgi:hypothetical protein
MLLGLLLLLQSDDPVHLKWSLDRSQKLQFEWTLVYKSETRNLKDAPPGVSLTTKIKALGEVQEITFKNEAKIKLTILSYSTHGTAQGKPVDMEYVDGKIVSTEIMDQEAILKQMKTAADMTVGRLGSVTIRWGDQAKPEAMGFLGGRLHDSGVALGDTWEDSMSVPTGTGSDRILPVKPKLARVVDGIAEIEVHKEEPIEFATGKGKVQVKRSTRFDVKKHFARRAESEITLEISPAGKNPPTEWSQWVLSVDVTPQ